MEARKSDWEIRTLSPPSSREWWHNREEPKCRSQIQIEVRWNWTGRISENDTEKPLHRNKLVYASSSARNARTYHTTSNIFFLNLDQKLASLSSFSFLEFFWSRMSAHSFFACFGVVIVIAAALVGKSLLSWIVLIFAALIGIYCNKNEIIIIYKTFGRDWRSLKSIRVAYKFLTECENKDKTILDIFKEQVHKNPQKPVFFFEDQTWTFSDLDEFSNKVANVFQSAGYQKGDVVALLMGNCLEYVGIWVGLAKIGGIAALINTNLRNQPLVHCLNAARARAVIYSEEFQPAIDEIMGDISDLKKYRWGDTGSESSAHLNLLMSEASKLAPSTSDRTGYRDNVLYVYTSGTTGLPKAAVIPHHRLLLMSAAISCIIGVTENDIVYNPLPLFHTVGGLLGIVGAMTRGFSSVIRRKFSATAFWTDCIKYNCTVAQYIGEMCRYVMMVPHRAEDTQHKVKFVFGNGMKTSLWGAFQERFRLERICEIYGSTEGNTNLANVDATVGAVGFLPKIIPPSMVPLALIKVDEFGDAIRNSKGFCIRCAPNEPGMLIGMIVSSDATREFSGYVGDKKESEKKIIRNVFRKGDKAFLSGDVLVMDELGYLYFKDRTGDTFRWKSENVSTAEVEGIISSAIDLRDVLVYGVEVGNLEGRAGMATIVDPDSKLDLQALAAHLDKNLPPYARPLFLRLTDHADLTSTFKLKKLNFQKEGFDPEKIKDKLYFKHGNSGYVELTKQIYDDIISGAIRV